MDGGAGSAAEMREAFERSVLRSAQALKRRQMQIAAMLEEDGEEVQTLREATLHNNEDTGARLIELNAASGRLKRKLCSRLTMYIAVVTCVVVANLVIRVT
eukprot:gnl/Chilomastix_cuspidata/3800.p2 GENE.gnl/Chilomastix_cuspidata/3800~~gnl/Chilomastix_cuspidata/3800.p2  ORF type:complete len:101 (+),score=36.71 gnl/Chilomastix_cuspidata/3800:66-368(+)